MNFVKFVVRFRFQGNEESYHEFVDSYSSEVLAPILEMWVQDYIKWSKTGFTK